MAHIVIDNRESGTTTGRYSDKLVHYLQQIDHTNTYSILLKPHRMGLGLITAPNFTEVQCDIKEFTFAEQLKLPSLLYSLKPDVVHFCMVQQPLLYRGKTVTTMQDLTTLRFRNPAKNPVVFWLKQRIYHLVNYVVVRKSTQLLAISNYAKHDILSTLKAGNRDKDMTVTYNAADVITETAQPLPKLKNKKFIMYLGRPQPHKNLDRLLEAFAIIHKSDKNMFLVLAGKKDVLFERHEQKANTMGLSEFVFFTDYVTDGELRWLYEHCACYVFPSLSEGFGLPGIEAMAHGSPVACSSASCLPEVYGDAALYFDPLSPDDIASKIMQIVGDPALQKDLINRGREHIKQFSWKDSAKKTLAVYQKALDHSK